MRTVAVIVAAWRAEDWIEACLESIKRQKFRRGGWKVEVRIGVDGCPVTAGKLDELGRRYWWSEENVGPYVIRNTLIERAPADAFAIFDADDTMEREYLDRLLRMSGVRHIAGSARMTVNAKGKILSRRSPYAHGVSVIGREAWQKLGGYRPWRIAADSDLIARAKALGIRVRSTARPLYRRRKHPRSLTQRPETKYGGEARMAVWEESKRLVAEGHLYVTPRTVTLEEIRA